jgi:hypothetical protein
MHAIHPDDLLGSRMRGAGENARLYGCSQRPDSADRLNVGTFAAENREEVFPGRILPNGACNRDAAPEVQKIVGGIRRASRNTDRIPVFQHQHRSFTRDPGDVPIQKFVGNKVPNDENLPARELIQNL